MLPTPALGVLLAILARLPADKAPLGGNGGAPVARGLDEGPSDGGAAGAHVPVVAQAALKLAQVRAAVTAAVALRTCCWSKSMLRSVSND